MCQDEMGKTSEGMWREGGYGRSEPDVRGKGNAEGWEGATVEVCSEPAQLCPLLAH